MSESVGPDATRDAYDRAADLYAASIRGTEPEQAVELAALEFALSLLPAGADVLDAGCGAGRLLPWLAARGVRPHGVDLAPGMVARARHDHPGFDVREGSLLALPYDDGRFAAVVAWYSTIHLVDADLPRALAEAHRVLAPGGVVLVAFQAGAGSREVGQPFRAAGVDVVLHRHHRTLEQVAAVAEASGFTTMLRLERAPVAHERERQAVLVGRRDG